MALVIQSDGASRPMAMSTVRDKLYAVGFNNAIAFDGSDSATLIRGNAVRIMSGEQKNSTIEVVMGFKRPRKK